MRQFNYITYKVYDWFVFKKGLIALLFYSFQDSSRKSPFPSSRKLILPSAFQEGLCYQSNECGSLSSQSLPFSTYLTNLFWRDCVGIHTLVKRQSLCYLCLLLLSFQSFAVGDEEKEIWMWLETALTYCHIKRSQLQRWLRQEDPSFLQEGNSSVLGS